MYLLSSPVSGATPAQTERAKEATLTKRAASANREIQNLRHEVPFAFVFAHARSYNPTWSVDVSVVRSLFLSMRSLSGERLFRHLLSRALTVLGIGSKEKLDVAFSVFCFRCVVPSSYRLHVSRRFGENSRCTQVGKVDTDFHPFCLRPLSEGEALPADLPQR